MINITITAKAQKQLSKVDSRYTIAIIDAIHSLKTFPQVVQDIKRLKGQERKYRMRVGRYRILFELIEGEPKIIEIQAVKKRDEQTYH